MSMVKKLKNEADITALIQNDEWMMNVLRAAEQLNLPDWWIGAGFLRNKIWNYIEGKPSEPSRDIDLVYFNNTDTAEERDWEYDKRMSSRYPFAEWEIRNQAHMHYVNGFSPFTSSADGIAHWVETATCVAVRSVNGKLEYLFCYGTDDLFGLIARPTPFFQTDLKYKFNKRITDKQWQNKWPNLTVVRS